MKTIGFIAQEVNDVVPNAVDIINNYIPDELRNIETKMKKENEKDNEKDKWRLTIDDIKFESNHTGKCKFKVTNNQGNEIEKEINVESDKKSFIFDEEYVNIYLYGKEVNDFHVLDKNQIYALHHSAIQELSRRNDKIMEKNNIMIIKY